MADICTVNHATGIIWRISTFIFASFVDTDSSACTLSVDVQNRLILFILINFQYSFCSSSSTLSDVHNNSTKILQTNAPSLHKHCNSFYEMFDTFK